MGVDLVGRLENFKISNENFVEGNHSVMYGCATLGNHRVLRFDMITTNIGDKDLKIGDPKDPSVQSRYFVPEKEELTEGVGFKFKEQPFFKYSIRNDDSTIKISGYKEAFCFDGLEPESCSNQGLAAKGELEDTYGSEMACQFVIIDSIPDGEYILEATVNAPSVEAVKSYSKDVFIEEDNYDNNSVSVRLQIKGDNVTEIKGDNVQKV
jgi:lysyl oxidase